MGKFQEVDTKKPMSRREEEILSYWSRENMQERSVTEREGAPRFIFYEGPPTANGKPGIHHVLARTLKDSVCRYKTMQGYQVYRKAGWDTHGLPVEIEVEKQLGISSKPEIEKYGIEPFNQKCRESVFTYEKEWRRMTERIGYWLDMDNPYITLDNNYIESVWWILKRYFDEGLIYEGHKIMPYCSRCGTPLASHEVSLGYKDETIDSIYVKMRVDGAENEYFLVWTTTPWTLPSNVALAVHPEYTYVRARRPDDDNVYILVKDRVAAVLGGNVEILEELKGSDLIGTGYEQLLPSCLYRAIMPLRFMAPSLSPPRTVQVSFILRQLSARTTTSWAGDMNFPSCNRWIRKGSSHRRSNPGPASSSGRRIRISSSTSRPKGNFFPRSG